MADTGVKMAGANGGWAGQGGQARPFGLRLALSAVPILVFLAVWQYAPSAGLISPTVLPAPTTIMREVAELTMTGELVEHIAISLGRTVAGLALAIMLAVPLGFLLGGWFKTLETAVNPLLHMFSQANPFTLLPAFIAVLGLGELSKVTMILWVSMWPVLFGTVSGIRNVDPELVKMARSFGLSRGQLFERVLLPGALPSVFAGIRSATLLAFFFLIGAEMIGASSGLGYMISQACPFHQGSFQLEKMWAGIVTVALLGILLNGAVARIERRFSRWREGAEI
ncbi:ABC transporter permease [Methanomassiliicoccus luminyensis]|uniref:ABC transporter permease n=1 Tax=Methanomassiliicoccus luminyensis TaxID=1080712 RepID=UPI001F2CC40F|nr:ABC transporter permease [Methanomassiliicoccus luminyensis]